jgi:hypothetical protein
MSSFAVLGTPGNREVFLSLETATERQRQGIRRGFFRLGKRLDKDARRGINRGRKTGVRRRVTTRTGRRRWHIASAPGESHANVTFKLRDSLGWKVRGFERMDFGYGVATQWRKRAPRYASYVEEGTARMAARPSIQNAIVKVVPKSRDWFLHEMQKELAK